MSGKRAKAIRREVIWRTGGTPTYSERPGRGIYTPDSAKNHKSRWARTQDRRNAGLPTEYLVRTRTDDGHRLEKELKRMWRPRTEK